MRCNLIHPWFLTDQHLMAERRELRMIPPLVRTRITNGTLTQGIPDHFVLGSGHMLFWVPRMEYLHRRFNALTDEMIRRGFHPDLSIQFEVADAIEAGLYNDWEPNAEDYDVIVTRLRERIEKRFNWYKYCSTPITREWFEVTYPLPYLK